ncbi:ABC transporter substrate-binding protein [Marinovum sp. 2_MG-2023]|uniref:ABC transporter substrate-binding protein n=1 Tax=Roseobacteraceae TaxID=2854170 RepID=UPI001FD12137|nr:MULTISPECIES: ABC transporter substrate-binding protein [Roseobacteraceae]MCJ7872740.1 ABC transporter substrate-binding protein [Phaeobacter sp. J2-8]MDO6729960.1 ABC transporter substrate-binding protein [Marinovum sp. 2_MG-2023]MDO6779774.1 ABC transporter substrate-binding protein [Marinovum sp. 1_MG-2023]
MFKKIAAGMIASVFGVTASMAQDLPTLTMKESYKVGFAQAESNGLWRLAETESVKSTAADLGHQLVFTDAAGSAAKQVSDVRSLIAQGVDVILIAPREEKPLVPAVMAAKRAGIPVILLDRNVDQAVAQAGRDYVTFIGSDFVLQGKRVAEWLLENHPDGGKILEIEGTVGSSPANDRKTGFDTAIAANSAFEILDSQSGDFNRDVGRKVVETLLLAHPDADIIYSHSDEMTMGAISAIEAAGKIPGKDIMIVGIDAGKEVVEQVAAGKVHYLVESSPKMGPKAFETIDRLAAGEAIEPWVVLPDDDYGQGNAAAKLDQAW